jgi:hypothetical protein
MLNDMKGTVPFEKYRQKRAPQRLENRCHKLNHTADRYKAFKTRN